MILVNTKVTRLDRINQQVDTIATCAVNGYDHAAALGTEIAAAYAQSLLGSARLRLPGCLSFALH